MALSVRTRCTVVSLVFLLSAVSVAAQDTSLTLRHAVDEMQRARVMVNPGFDTEEQVLAHDLTEAIQALEGSGVLDLPLRPVAEGQPVDFLTAAGRKQRTFGAATFLASSALRELWNTVRRARNLNEQTVGRPTVLRPGDSRGILRRLQDDPRIVDAAIDGMFVAYQEIDRLLREDALAQAVDRLGRYERKFGPGSVQLNLFAPPRISWTAG